MTRQWLDMAKHHGAPTLRKVGSQTCTALQFSEPDYDRLCAEIKQGKAFHRKQWEYVYILRVLESYDLLRPGARGIGFGCGKEPLAAVMAKYACDVVATDIPSTPQGDAYWGSSCAEELFYPGICDKEMFLRRVKFKTVNMTAIPEDLGTYDFLWSSCAFEHLGSLRAGLKFVLDADKCLRPGGIAIHTTEYNVSSDDETLETPGLCLYRRRDLLSLAEQIERLGSHMLPPNFAVGDLPQDRYVDLPPYEQKIHLKLMVDKFVTTSFGFVIVKNSW
jgi:SAM-dependent methyltransferase